jgi:DNA-binding transcriptional ArsR family regulator
MEESDAVLAFAALAQETRIRLVSLLARAGRDGMAAGDIAGALGVSASNISFHLKELERAGLVTARRSARQIFYAADQAALGALVKFMFENLQAERPRVRIRIG